MIAVMSQKNFRFMAAPMYGQWVCHSPNVMKTDIFAGNEGEESGKSTRGSIRFDSSLRQGQTKVRRVLVSFVDAHPAPEVKVSSAAWQPKQRRRPKKQSRTVV